MISQTMILRMMKNQTLRRMIPGKIKLVDLAPVWMIGEMNYMVVTIYNEAEEEMISYLNT